MKKPKVQKMLTRLKPIAESLQNGSKTEHPDIKRVDRTRLDSATLQQYEKARAAAESKAEHDALYGDGVAKIAFHSPFRFGFVATIGVLCAIALAFVLQQASTVIVYVGAALFIALGLDPLVRKLESRGLNRSLAIALVFAGFLGLVALALSIILPVIIEQVAQLVQNAPAYFIDLSHQKWYLDLSNRLADFINLDELLRTGRKFASNPDNITTVAGGVAQAGLGIANGITATIIVLILSLYFLASLRAMKRGFYALISQSKRARVIDITEQVTDSVGGYITGQLTIASINAVLGFVVMSIIDVPFAPVLAVCVFLLALIPLVGAISASVLVTTVALFNSPTTALIIGIYYLIYMQIEAYVITPRVMSKVVSVPGAFVVIGVFTGGTLLGLLGALIAIPVTAAILMIVKQVWIPNQDQR